MTIADNLSTAETGAVYTITGEDNTQAVINDPSSSFYVGSVGADGITGLDHPEVRENAWALVEADGGVHGNFWLGRRPITMTFEVIGTSVTQRNNRLQRLKQAQRALRGDGTIKWTPTGSVEQQVSFRTQQPMRVAGSWLKTVFIGLVCADPRIYSTALHSTAGINEATPTTIHNAGDFPSPPSLRIHGPGTNPVVKNAGVPITFSGLTLAAGDYVDVDLLQRTVIDNTGASRYSTIDFLNTTWWYIYPGDNTVRIDWGSGSTAASDLDVTWRDAWV